ncbi:MAG: hypothetical protein ABR555_05190 [Pyrinomonadaceae bacterium]
MKKLTLFCWNLGLLLPMMVSVAITAEVAAAQTTPFRCQIISASRVKKLEGGFFSWTPTNPDKATGVILVAKLSYPSDTKELLSGDVTVEYKVGSQTERSPALGFNPRGPDPNRSPDADKLFWILHAESTYKYPVEGDGFDGVKGQETMQFLFQVPNDVPAVTLLYQGKSCGEEAKIPKR